MNLENLAKYIASKMDICQHPPMNAERFKALDFSMLDDVSRIELLYLTAKFCEDNDQGCGSTAAYEKTNEAINNILERNQSKEHLAKMGDLCVKYKNFSDAIRLYKKAENKEALLKVAGECIEQGKVELAIDAYNAAGETGEPFAKFLNQFAQKRE